MIRLLNIQIFNAVILITANIFISKISYAAGYELLEQSSQGTGTSFAGTANGFGDGSEVFFNPAALTKLNSNVASAHVHFIIPHAEFENKGSKLSPELGSTQLSGNAGGDAGGFNSIPNFYSSNKLSEDVTLGIGVNSPFGLNSKYNDTWVGRYNGIESSLQTINIVSGLGVKLSDQLAVGANVHALYADAKISNAVDFGSIGVAALGLPTASKFGLLPQQADGFAKVTANDWGVGSGLGAVYSPSDDISFGINWRSRIQLQLQGDADFDLPANAEILNSNGQFSSTNTVTDLTLPESINFGIAAKINARWKILADSTWIRWDRFQELRVNFDSSLPDNVQEQGWNNTWRFALGANYMASENWTLKTGVSYDQTPIASSDLRSPRIPDNDRYWFSIGADYNLTENSSICFAYAHLFIPEADSSISNDTGANFTGSWDLSVEIISLGFVQRF